MTNTTEDCIRYCITCAEICRRAEQKCLSMPDMQAWIARFDECANVCDRAQSSLAVGSNAECVACAEACEKMVDDLRIYDYQFTEDAAKACMACMESCREMAKMGGGSVG